MPLTDAFVNSARKLFITDGAATPALSFIPTTTMEEQPADTEETWHSSSDVVGGQAHENGAITGTGMSFNCECVFEKDGAATPALKASLKTIRDLKFGSSSARRRQFVWVEADGTMRIAWFDVMNIASNKGDTKSVAKLSWTLKRRGADAEYTGTLPE
jgi:hypothetical protein